MTISPAAIDRIVANVLNQLGAKGDRAAPRPAPVAAAASPQPTAASIIERVVTAELLEQFAPNTVVNVLPKAIVTPAGWDAAKDRNIQIQRGAAAAKASSAPSASGTPTVAPLLIVVQNAESVERIWGDLTGAWQRDLLGCPDDAAKRAISAICRGEASLVVIVAEQAYRAACLANRNEQVKAVAIRDAGDVKAVRKQLRANVWCLDPSGRTYFEFKSLFRELVSSGAR